MLAALSALLIAGLAPYAAEATPSGTPVAGFGIQPAAKGKPDGRSYFTYSATPGARLTDEVAVRNLSTKPVTLHIYATDATSTGSGGFTLFPAAEKPVDLGTWVSITGPRLITVPARTSKGPSYVVVPFRLAIPANASPGDHAGGVVVSLTGTAVNPQGIDVALDQRVAARVLVRVSGKIQAGLVIENPKLGFGGASILNPFGDGHATLSYTVHNTGNVTLGAKVTATISSWLGSDLTIKSLPIVPPLLPGTSVRIDQQVLSQLKDPKIPSEFSVYPGVRLTATIRLTPQVPAGPTDPHVSSVSVSTSIWAIPWALLILIVIVAGLGLLGWRYLRRPRRPVSDRPNSHAYRRSPALSRAGAR